MQQAYRQDAGEDRKLAFLYRSAGIDTRYSVIPDYSLPMNDWQFFPATDSLEPFPSLEKRMGWFRREAAPLCAETIQRCIDGKAAAKDVTHLITVSCTGMSAPGLDLEVMELMGFAPNISRTSVNFMGCYAAIHALKMAQGICAAEPAANVVVVCLEFCTLHFQKEFTVDNITASLLFADGCAALLIKADNAAAQGLMLNSFYAEVALKGKHDMAWELSSTGFLMTLTSYVSHLVEEDFEALVTRALAHGKLDKAAVTHWCIHPGGKKILEAIEKSMGLGKDDLYHAYEVLKSYGNMSSPTVLFVLQRIFTELAAAEKPGRIFGAAFGPGLTMETFIASYG